MATHLVRILFLALLFGCAAGGPGDDPAQYLIRLEAAGEQGFRATLPDGTVYSDPEAYVADYPTITAFAEAAGVPIAFALDESVSGDLGTATQALTASGQQGLPFGYLISFRADDGQYVGGCMARPAYPGAALRMERNGSQLWELQLGRYRQNGATCLGLYESRTAYTKCGCGPRTPELPDEIRDALIRRGVQAAAAWVVAKAVTPVVNGVMALAL